MRINPFCLLLIVAVPALVTAATQTNCIVGCKCDEQKGFSRNVEIQECGSPLVLSNKTLLGVSKKVTIISIKNASIQRIEKGAFEGFNALETVIIEDSNIGSIDPSVFNLPELGTINFAKTTFGQVPSLSSEYLEELIFNDCKLTQVPNLVSLPALNFINLANNFIETVDENTFANVDSLEEVTLSNNSISYLPPNLFNNNPEFNTLNVDYNPLTKFDLSFETDLELLSLRNCKLTTFDKTSTKNLEMLTSLDLSGNEISTLPIDAFETMKNLINLNLSNNKLVELDDDIFLENIKLDKIILDNNPFEKLPNFQVKEKFLQINTFSCKNCGLKSVKGVFDNISARVTIDLSNNEIEDIEGVFTHMRTLKELDLSNNKITSVGINAFSTNSELDSLDLSNNPLLPLDPVVLSSIPLLKKLNVTNSKLDKLWTNYNANLPSLEQLYVKNNILTVITVDDVKIMPQLKLLHLEANPLVCTPEVYDLYDYLIAHTIYPKVEAIKTHESLTDSIGTYNVKQEWESVFPSDCLWDVLEDEEDDDNEFQMDDIVQGDDYDEENEYDDEEEKEPIGIEPSVLNTGSFSLAKASYILSITSVFILTALLVLFVAVMVTLLILKRNKSFKMHNSNLPRLKIPLWHTTPGQKKHSGSVYKPLSEELSGSRTPIINRYEFKQTPQIHNPLP